MNLQPEEKTLIEFLIATSGIGIVVGLLKSVIEDNHNGFKGFFSGLAACLLVSVIVGLGLAKTGLGNMTVFAIVGVCGYISADMLAGIRKIGAAFGANPMAFIQSMRETIAGGKKE